LLNSTKIIMDTYHDNVDGNREFDKEVIIKPPVFIGKNVKIKNSTIGPYASIGDNSKIENTKINNSIIFNSVEINNSEIDNSIIGSNSKFEGSGTKIFLGDNSKSINDEM